MLKSAVRMSCRGRGEGEGGEAAGGIGEGGEDPGVDVAVLLEETGVVRAGDRDGVGTDCRELGAPSRHELLVGEPRSIRGALFRQ